MESGVVRVGVGIVLFFNDRMVLKSQNYCVYCKYNIDIFTISIQGRDAKTTGTILAYSSCYVGILIYTYIYYMRVCVYIHMHL